MKTTKVLELLAGIATFFFVLRISYLQYLFSAKHSSEPIYFYRERLIVIIPAILVVLGAYLHTTKQRAVSIIGLLMVCICGGWLSFLYFVTFMVGMTSDIDPLVFVLPAFFAITTVFLALATVMLSASENLAPTPKRKRFK